MPARCLGGTGCEAVCASCQRSYEQYQASIEWLHRQPGTPTRSEQMEATLRRMEAALRRIADINNGPDQASGEWRCLEAQKIAEEALRD